MHPNLAYARARAELGVRISRLPDHAASPGGIALVATRTEPAQRRQPRLGQSCLQGIEPPAVSPDMEHPRLV
eukprot:10930571-Alexandrium_andersonii.AAC.1